MRERPREKVNWVREYPVPSGTRPHDVAPARDGGVWYTAQALGRARLARPEDRQVAAHRARERLGAARRHRRAGRSAVDHRRRAERDRARRSPHAEGPSLPASGEQWLREPQHGDLRPRGVLWFTGQSGIYGRLDPKVGKVRVFRAPRGEGPYGITTTPSGAVYYASLAGSYLGRIDVRTGKATVAPAADAAGRAARVVRLARARSGSASGTPGKVGDVRPALEALARVARARLEPDGYAVYVDERDKVWLSDFGANALVRFDPDTARFTSVALPSADAAVRQILGGRARSGAPSPGPTSSSSSRRAEREGPPGGGPFVVCRTGLFSSR